jgi:hypothetical protein
MQEGIGPQQAVQQPPWQEVGALRLTVLTCFPASFILPR